MFRLIKGFTTASLTATSFKGPIRFHTNNRSAYDLASAARRAVWGSPAPMKTTGSCFWAILCSPTISADKSLLLKYCTSSISKTHALSAFFAASPISSNISGRSYSILPLSAIPGSELMLISTSSIFIFRLRAKFLNPAKPLSTRSFALAVADSDRSTFPIKG